MKLEFSGQIVENSQVSKLMRLCPVGAELFFGNGWTDKRGEANSRSSQFCKPPK
jgi:hypothetical protein